MTAPRSGQRLRRLAVLYLSMAHRSDDILTDARLESVTRRLIGRSGGRGRDAVQSIVMEVLRHFAEGETPDDAVQRSARELRECLTTDEREDVLNDLAEIARADGVVLEHERRILRSLADVWGIALEEDVAPGNDEPWGVLHDLAYIYLVLAHGTDQDLSETEVQVMLNKLREWQPEAPTDDVRRMLRLAMTEYSQGPDEARLEKAIASVRSAMPREQRMAALNDLVKIANADGVFLDDEEDLINRLQTEWDVDPSANYEPHSDKSVDG